MNQTTDTLKDLLQPERLCAVVDIGANPIDGDPPYQTLLNLGLCQVTGFEPQPEALEQLNISKSSLETYLPHCVGDGQSHTLHICAASGMSSLFKPDPRYLALFNDFDLLGEVTSSIPVDTRRLDDINEISELDFLKIDIQGGELAVFEAGRQKLRDAVFVQTEVSFMPLYENQPMYWEIDRELRAQGFVPHSFANLKHWPVTPYANPDNYRQGINQLLEADAVYVKDFVDTDSLGNEQLKQMALIAHHCYGSHDLTTRCISALSQRSAIEATAVNQYRRDIFPNHTFFGDVDTSGLPFSLNLD